MTSVDPDQTLIFVTVGSDHHQFDRLVGWIDDWLVDKSPDRVRVVVQYGTSTTPKVAEGHDFLAHQDLQDLMRAASVIVTQGGPMSIHEARLAGTVPIVVPRNPDLGEHVDGHQQAFAARMGQERLAYLATSYATLTEYLDRALAAPDEFVAHADDAMAERIQQTTNRIAALVDELIAAPESPTRRARSASSTSRPIVVMIVGVGRSGSTLFERAVGEVPRVMSLGETVHLWERGARDDELCGCGEPFSRCEFWHGVGKRAFGGWDRVDVEDVIELRHAVVRTRYVPALLRTTLRVGWRLKRDRLARLLTAFYQAVAAEAREYADADVLIDSSKMPAYAALLTRSDIDLRCVQVVRDPRGVAYSWTKVVQRPEIVDAEVDMPTYGVAESAMWWSVFDVLFRRIGKRGVPIMTVRYEDFVADPRDAVRRVLEFSGLTPQESDLAHLSADSVELRPGHLVAGNPMRFTSGRLDLVPDEEWRRRLPARDRTLISAITAPLRRRYRYR